MAAEAWDDSTEMFAEARDGSMGMAEARDGSTGMAAEERDDSTEMLAEARDISMEMAGKAWDVSTKMAAETRDSSTKMATEVRDDRTEMAVEAWDRGTEVAAEAQYGSIEMAAEAWEGSAEMTAEAREGNAEMSAEVREGSAEMAADAQDGSTEMAAEVQDGSTEMAAEAQDGSTEMAAEAQERSTEMAAEVRDRSTEMAAETGDSSTEMAAEVREGSAEMAAEAWDDSPELEAEARDGSTEVTAEARDKSIEVEAEAWGDTTEVAAEVWDGSIKLEAEAQDSSTEVTSKAGDKSTEVVAEARDGDNEVAAETQDGSTEVAAEAQDGSTEVAAEAQDGSTELAAEAQDSSMELAAEVQDSSTEVAAKAQDGSKEFAAETQDSSTEVAAKAQDGSTEVAGEAQDGSTEVAAEAQDGSTEVAAEAQDGSTEVAAEAQDGSTGVAAEEQDGRTEVAAKEQDGRTEVAAEEQDGRTEVAAEEQDGRTGVAAEEQDGRTDVQAKAQDGSTQVEAETQDGSTKMTVDTENRSVELDNLPEGYITNLKAPSEDGASMTPKQDSQESITAMHLMSSSLSSFSKPETQDEAMDTTEETTSIEPGNVLDPLHNPQLNSNTCAEVPMEVTEHHDFVKPFDVPMQFNEDEKAQVDSLAPVSQEVPDTAASQYDMDQSQIEAEPHQPEAEPHKGLLSYYAFPAQEPIVSQLQSTRFFSITYEQHVEIEGYAYIPVSISYLEKQPMLCEDVLAYVPLEEDTGLFVESVIEALSEKWGLNLALCRGQSLLTVGPAGVQVKAATALFSQRFPHALRTLNNSVSLSTWLARSCTITGIAESYLWVENLLQWVTEDSGNQAKLCQSLDSLFQENDPKRSELRLQLTRGQWERNHDTLEFMLDALHAILLCLHEIKQDDDAQIASFLVVLQNFEFILILVIMKNILALTKDMSQRLQADPLDLCQAVTELPTLLTALHHLANNIESFLHSWYQEAVMIAARLQISVDPTLQETVIDHYRDIVSKGAIEHVVTEIADLWSDHVLSALRCLQVVPSVVANMPGCCSDPEDFSSYLDDLPNLNVLQDELHKWRDTWLSVASHPDLPCSLLDVLKLPQVGSYPNVEVLLRCLAVLPCCKPQYLVGIRPGKMSLTEFQHQRSLLELYPL